MRYQARSSVISSRFSRSFQPHSLCSYLGDSGSQDRALQSTASPSRPGMLTWCACWSWSGRRPSPRWLAPGRTLAYIQWRRSTCKRKGGFWSWRQAQHRPLPGQPDDEARLVSVHLQGKAEPARDYRRCLGRNEAAQAEINDCHHQPTTTLTTSPASCCPPHRPYQTQHSVNSCPSRLPLCSLCPFFCTLL